MNELTKKDAIDGMIRLEELLKEVPGAKLGDDAYSLEHFFADGLYIRVMYGEQGTINVSKLHKTTHPYFVMKGDAVVFTENGKVRVKGPHFGITKAGTKRVVYFNEDTIWVTVHATNERDLDRIEKETIAESYNELPEEVRKSLGYKKEEVLT
jgi:hypothetical protein